jgi:hypothetical protein
LHRDKLRAERGRHASSMAQSISFAFIDTDADMPSTRAQPSQGLCGTITTRVAQFLSDSMLFSHAIVLAAALGLFTACGVRFRLVDGSWSWSDALWALAGAFALVHLAMFWHLLVVSWRFVRQLESEAVGVGFLFKTYAAMILLFASSYFVTFFAAGSKSFSLGSSVGLNDFTGDASDLVCAEIMLIMVLFQSDC